MSLLGIRLTMLIGPQVPVPAPPAFMEALEKVTVTHNDEGRSGFQIVFRAGRGRSDLLDYALLANPLLRPFNRVILTVTFGAFPQVLMDGMLTDQQLFPSNRPGESTLTVTGEDVSLMMDLEEESAEHPVQPEALIAFKLIGKYARYGMIPQVIPPPSIDIPPLTERTPVQQCSNLQYLQMMAERFGYVFYVTPGPVPGANTAYWGPPVRVGAPQKAISVNLGPYSNAQISDSRYDSLATALVTGQVQDRRANRETAVQTRSSTRQPLASQPAWAAQSHLRTRRFRQCGLDAMQALTRAQAETDASTDQAVVMRGELDASRYEALLQPRRLVGVRGVGNSYDGCYYVKSVTHNIRRGEYKQEFTLTREGVGTLCPVVNP